VKKLQNVAASNVSIIAWNKHIEEDGIRTIKTLLGIAGFKEDVT